MSIVMSIKFQHAKIQKGTVFEMRNDTINRIVMDRDSKIRLFTSYVDEYLALVSRTSFRILCDRKDSEAVSASVFKRFWTLMDRCDDVGTLLYRLTCRYSFLRLVRRHILWIFQIRPDVFVTSRASGSPAEEYMKREAWEIFCRASSRMSPFCRIVYTLCELEELSVRKASYILHMKDSVVHAALVKARTSVRRELGRYGKVSQTY